MTTSINAMVKRIAGLEDTKDVSERENDFIKSVISRTNNGDDTTRLSPKQVAWVEDLYLKHFA